jgi:hypothetical protein
VSKANGMGTTITLAKLTNITDRPTELVEDAGSTELLKKENSKTDNPTVFAEKFMQTVHIMKDSGWMAGNMEREKRWQQTEKQFTVSGSNTSL